MTKYSSRALSIIMLSLLATLSLAYALPQTSSPFSNNSNPPPFSDQKAPVSETVSTYLNLIQHIPSMTSTAGGPNVAFSASVVSDPTIVFNLDSSPLPQNEGSVAVNPATNTIVGGYNEFRRLLALLNIGPAGFTDCSISYDGGASVRSAGELPRVTLALAD